MPNKPHHFGQCIRQLREKAGLSTKQLSNMAGITPSYLSQLEAGERDRPSPTVLAQLAAIIGDTKDFEEMLRCCGYLI